MAEGRTSNGLGIRLKSPPLRGNWYPHTRKLSTWLQNLTIPWCPKLDKKKIWSLSGQPTDYWTKECQVRGNTWNHKVRCASDKVLTYWIGIQSAPHHSLNPHLKSCTRRFNPSLQNALHPPQSTITPVRIWTEAPHDKHTNAITRSNILLLFTRSFEQAYKQPAAVSGTGSCLQRLPKT